MANDAAPLKLVLSAIFRRRISTIKVDNKLKFALCFFVVLLLAGCATYRAMEFANEVTYLRKHQPSETIWLDNWGNEPWKSRYSSDKLNKFTLVWVRPPETVKNWTEMLTKTVEWRTSKVYTFPGVVTFTVVPDPLHMMKAIKQSAQTRCGNPVIFRKLDEDRTGHYPSVIFYIACDKIF